MSHSANISPAIEVGQPTPSSALQHFEALLRLETDCWDVHASLASPEPGFVLLDVRSPDAYAKGHVPGAVNLPHRRITESNMAKSSTRHDLRGVLQRPALQRR